MGSITLGYVNTWQHWFVPTGVTSITLDIYGAGGAPGFGSGFTGAHGVGGGGERILLTVPVTPGQKLWISTGQSGQGDSGGYSPGPAGAGGGSGGYADTVWAGGGGAGTAVAIGVNGETWIAVAAGGGGGGMAAYPGDASAGGRGGYGGTAGSTAGVHAGSIAQAGGGSTATLGGIAGKNGTTTAPGAASSFLGQAGSSGFGGYGGDRSGQFWALGGGGGGGWFGGGGGGTDTTGTGAGSIGGAGGGGGSGYINPSIGITAITRSVNANGGNGAVVITWTDPPAIPVANFTATPLTGPEDLVVQFTDTSSSTRTAWEWDFGDGTAFGNTQNPQHTYVNPGTYTVRMRATNVSGTSAWTTKTNYITVTVVAPTADFGFFGNAIEGVPFQFGNLSTGQQITYNWDFGTSGVADSADFEPLITFPNAGTFTVTLTATNPGGSDQQSYDVVVEPVGGQRMQMIV